MPDLDQIKQGEQGVRDRRGRFVKGRSGNPANRPRGCHHHQARPDRRGAGAAEPKTGQPPDCRDQVGHREDGNGSSLERHAEGSLFHQPRPATAARICGGAIERAEIGTCRNQNLLG